MSDTLYELNSSQISVFGLIGFPLTHSFSQKFFNEKFAKEKISNSVFELFPLQDISEIYTLLESYPNLKGLSITIPYKEKIMNFLNEMDVTSKTIGAVNSVKIERREGRPFLIGFNTDTFGFEKSLVVCPELKGRKALILGTGGASKAVEFILNKKDIPFLNVSRTNKEDKFITYNEIDEPLIKEYNFIINTTPLGMFPNIDDCPQIPYNSISENHIFYDLTYNPEETMFLKKGKERGAFVINGLCMLHHQAEKSWEIWNEE